jgi:hypothetical protein
MEDYMNSVFTHSQIESFINSPDARRTPWLEKEYCPAFLEDRGKLERQAQWDPIPFLSHERDWDPATGMVA